MFKTQEDTLHAAKVERQTLTQLQTLQFTMVTCLQNARGEQSLWNLQTNIWLDWRPKMCYGTHPRHCSGAQNLGVDRPGTWYKTKYNIDIPTFTSSVNYWVILSFFFPFNSAPNNQRLHTFKVYNGMFW